MVIEIVIEVVATAFFAGCAVALGSAPYFKARRQEQAWLQSHDRGDK